MDLYQIALKTMHFPAGLVARGVVELGKKAVTHFDLQKPVQKIAKGHATEIIGIGIPTLDTILEYTHIKDFKDGIVQPITHGVPQPPNIEDQINDIGWFWLGYFFPEVCSIYKQGLTNVYQKIKEKI